MSGVLVKQGLVDLSYVEDLLYFSITSHWNKIKPLLMERRQEDGIPILACYYEFLANEIEKRHAVIVAS